MPTGAASTTWPSAGRILPSTCGWPRPITAWPPRCIRPARSKPRSPTGVEVRIAEVTWYPLGDFVDLTVRTDREVNFPLYLRVPEWSKNPEILINGIRQSVKLKAGEYALIRRDWKNGDQVRFGLCAPGSRSRSGRNGRMPSQFAAGRSGSRLRSAKSWKRYAGTDEWPAHEILPTTPWNYGLDVDPARPEAGITLVGGRPGLSAVRSRGGREFLPQCQGQALRDWKAEGRMVGKMPAGPPRPGGDAEDVLLVPMGCARLRIAVFPRAS